jgi:hypothetical protein
MIEDVMSRVIDLTLPLASGDRGVLIEPARRLETDGWSDYYGRSRFRDELPRVSADLARWCVDNKVRMLGVEPPSVADVNDIEELTAIHKILFEGGVIVVEGLASLALLSKIKGEYLASFIEQSLQDNRLIDKGSHDNRSSLYWLADRGL